MNSVNGAVLYYFVDGIRRIKTIQLGEYFDRYGLIDAEIVFQDPSIIANMTVVGLEKLRDWCNMVHQAIPKVANDNI